LFSARNDTTGAYFGICRAPIPKGRADTTAVSQKDIIAHAGVDLLGKGDDDLSSAALIRDSFVTWGWVASSLQVLRFDTHRTGNVCMLWTSDLSPGTGQLSAYSTLAGSKYTVYV
jgi:hypothetical protein